MIYISYDKSTGRSEMIHYMPFDAQHGLGKTAEELSETGLLVEALPEAEQREGFVSTLYVDLASKTPYYKYEEAPVQEENEIVSLKRQLAEQQEAINFLLLGGE